MFHGDLNFFWLALSVSCNLATVNKQIGFNMCLTGVKLAGFAFKVWKMECSTVDSGYLGPKTGC